MCLTTRLYGSELYIIYVYCHRKHSLFDFKPEGFAKQMTLLDAGYFYKLDVRYDHYWQLTIFFVLQIYEMLCWAAEADEEKSPGLTKFTEHFNNVSQW